jgi:hypothetical protein
MSVERVKLNAAIWLLLGLLIGVLVGLGINKIRMKEIPVGNPTFISGRVVNITIDQSQQDELFAQLEKFAEKWRYVIQIELTDLDCIYSVEMWRSDIHVSGVYSYKAKSGELQLAFSDTESTRPTPAQYFEEEIQDLKNFINEIPNSTFTFWTPPPPPN